MKIELASQLLIEAEPLKKKMGDDLAQLIVNSYMMRLNSYRGFIVTREIEDFEVGVVYNVVEASRDLNEVCLRMKPVNCMQYEVNFPNGYRAHLGWSDSNGLKAMPHLRQLVGELNKRLLAELIVVRTDDGESHTTWKFTVKN